MDPACDLSVERTYCYLEHASGDYNNQPVFDACVDQRYRKLYAHECYRACAGHGEQPSYELWLFDAGTNGKLLPPIKFLQQRLPYSIHAAEAGSIFPGCAAHYTYAATWRRHNFMLSERHYFVIESIH